MDNSGLMRVRSMTTLSRRDAMKGAAALGALAATGVTGRRAAAATNVSMPAPVTVFDTPEQLGGALAGEILDRTRAALRRRRRFLLGCPSGRTPRVIYQALARRAAEANDNLSHLVIVMMDEYLNSDGKGGFVTCPMNAHYSCLGFAFREIQAPVNQELPADACIPDHHIWIPDPADPGEYDARLADAGGVDLFIMRVDRMKNSRSASPAMRNREKP